MEISRYWSSVSNVAGINLFKHKDEAFDAVAASLKEAVSLQMISDVPLGAFLSGGIDSSAVVSLMRQTHQGPIKTFSIVFDVPQFDERQYASAVARQNGTEHIELELTGRMAQAHLGEALNAFDQPSMDGLNTWFVSRLVKGAGLTVALSGLGGDELFVGYGGFSKPLSMMRWQKLIGWLPPGIGERIANRAKTERVRKFGQLMGYDLPAYFLSRRVFSQEKTGSLLTQNCGTDLKDWRHEAFSRIITDAKGLPALDQIALYEMGSYMLSTLLRDTDQMSMAHSLEVRVPLIDHRVVETMLRVPCKWKRDSRTPKPILVNAAGSGIPPSCVYRPKQGFTLPFESWFQGCIKGEVEAFCNGGGSDIFDPSGLRSLWQQFELGHIGWSRIWGLFVLNHWLKTNKVSIN
jgi:asparagine synthase (glutamine-hydrolysing)